MMDEDLADGGTYSIPVQTDNSVRPEDGEQPESLEQAIFEILPEED